MNITHKLPGMTASEDGCDNPFCILSNGIGSFLFLSEPAVSKFNGFFFNDNLEIYKVIERISVPGSVIGFENNITSIRRKHDKNIEKIIMPQGINGMMYTLQKKDTITIDFDCRRVIDMRKFGRMYDISFKNDNIIIQFTKKTDKREDDSDGKEEFSFFTVIQPNGFDMKKDYKFIDKWKEADYRYDKERGDPPTSRYLYHPFTINTKELRIAFGKTEKDAFAELEKLKKHQSTEPKGKKTCKTIDKKKDPDAAAAFICCQASLEGMKVEHEGITRLYAGYPWYFQFWSRDENISLGALIKLKQFKTVKRILFKYMKSIGKDGRLPNHIPSPHLGSADGVGWFWKRMGDLINGLKKEDLLAKHISLKELKDVKTALAGSIKKIEKNYMKDGLITNRHKETWMDTDYQGHDGRKGACIEIQALHLNMLKLLHDLTGDKKHKTVETRFRKKVVDNFWNKNELADMAGDFTQRPNIFIAYYAYPDLISRRDWQTAFESCLRKTWLDWGGLATIDKGHELFTDHYTGRDNQSYHRGDSWYWINNLAALCMFRNNQIKFERKIIKVIEASSKEILWNGAIGHPAEVSSASNLSSKGCFAQAWSAAMFIELITEVYK
jgi:hypothetical protein